MSTAIYQLGSVGPVPQDEEDARDTVEPIRNDGPAEADAPPDWNEFETDSSSELKGLSRRTEGADTTDINKYRPWWAALIAPVENGISAVFNRQADMGTAAKREESGVQGHGSMQYANSIDPVIREGMAFGNDYFVTLPKDIQEGAGNYMTPAENDSWALAIAQARGVDGQRAAAQSTLYRNFMAGR